MSAFFDASTTVYGELSAQSADFKKIWDAMKAFRAEENLWFQLTEGNFDQFMFAQQRAGKL